MSGGEVLERNQFTERARLAVLFARRVARERQAPTVGPEHLLLGLLYEEEGTGADILTGHGMTIVGVTEAIGPPLRDDPGSEVVSVGFEPSAERALERAVHEARWVGKDYAATEHVLLGLLHEAEGLARRLLLDAGVSEDGIRAELAKRRR